MYMYVNFEIHTNRTKHGYIFDKIDLLLFFSNFEITPQSFKVVTDTCIGCLKFGAHHWDLTYQGEFKFGNV